MITIVAALLAAVGYGAADFFGGLATTRAPTLAVVVLSQTIGILTVFALVWVLPAAHPHGVDLAWGAAAGIVGGSGLALFYRALGRTVMSVVAPVTALACTLVPVLYGLGMGEHPGTKPLIGIGLALVAIVLVSISVTPSREGAVRRIVGAVPAEAIIASVAAGTCFGSFYVIIRQAAPAAGIWPLAAGRAASVVLYLVATVMTRRPLPVFAPRDAWPVIVAAGALDMLANICYLCATHRGLLTIVGVLASLYPVTTIALACVVRQERLSRTQTVGLVLGGGAVLLIGQFM